MRTIGYARVSTDKQAEQGVSLEAQAEKIRASFRCVPSRAFNARVKEPAALESCRVCLLALLIEVPDFTTVRTVGTMEYFGVNAESRTGTWLSLSYEKLLYRA